MLMTVILCNKCKALLMSKYSGQFVSCQCEDKDRKFVDQTEHYGRIGGDPNGMQKFTIDVDWTKTEKPFVRKLDDFPYLASGFMLRNSRTGTNKTPDDTPKGKSKASKGRTRKNNKGTVSQSKSSRNKGRSR